MMNSNSGEFLEIGKINNTHGLKGEIKVMPWCDDVGLFSMLGSVFIQSRLYEIEGVKYHKNSAILKLNGIESIEEAEKMRNEIICAGREQLGELPENTYYIKDLIGIDVFCGGERLGTLVDCFPTGSNDVYDVRRDDGRRLLLPAIKQVIKNVDIEARRMDIELIEGLDE